MKNPFILPIIFSALVLFLGYWLGNQFPWSDPRPTMDSSRSSTPSALPSLPPPMGTLPAGGGTAAQPTLPAAPDLPPPTVNLPAKIEQPAVARSLTDFITEYQLSEAQKTAMAAEITRLLNQSLPDFKAGLPPPDPAFAEADRQKHEKRMIEILGSQEMLTEFQRFQRSRELRATLQQWAAAQSASGVDISPPLQKQVRTVFIEEQEKALAAARKAFQPNPGLGQMGISQQMSDLQRNSQSTALEATWKRLEPLLDPASLSSLRESMTTSDGQPRIRSGSPPSFGR